MKSTLSTAQGKKNKIIWAVDPFHKSKDYTGIIKELKVWSQNINCDILPVAIFSNPRLLFQLQKKSEQVSYQDMATKQLIKFIEKLPTKGFLEPKAIFIDSDSHRQMAIALAQYAEKSHAKIIFTNTQAKKTWNPFRLGGFAETLIAVTHVPVLLLNHKAKPSNEIPLVLFPTDFSKESSNALAHLTPWLKSFQSKLQIYSQVEDTYSYTPFYEGYYSTFDWSSSMKELEKRRKKEALALVTELKKSGIESEVVIQKQKNSLSSDILQIARKNQANLIVMSNHGGPMAQAFLGGTARDVLLQANCPVLIFHRPQLPSKKATAKSSHINKGPQHQEHDFDKPQPSRSLQ